MSSTAGVFFLFYPHHGRKPVVKTGQAMEVRQELQYIHYKNYSCIKMKSTPTGLRNVDID